MAVRIAELSHRRIGDGADWLIASATPAQGGCPSRWMARLFRPRPGWESPARRPGLGPGQGV